MPASTGLLCSPVPCGTYLLAKTFPPPKQSLGARVLTEGICCDKTDAYAKADPAQPWPSPDTQIRDNRATRPHSVPALAGAPCIEDLLSGNIPQRLQGINL